MDRLDHAPLKARRDELVRPAFVDLDKEGAFWRVVRADYEDDEMGVFPDPALFDTREECRIRA